MTTNQIISDLYINKEVDNCILKMVPYNLAQDFKQELFVIVSTMNSDLIQALHSKKQLRYYVVRIIINLCKNKRWIFHKKYLDNSIQYNTDVINNMNVISDCEHIEDRITNEAKEQMTIAEIEQFDKRFNTPYFRMLVHTVNHYGSMREASRQTGIAVSVISKSMKKIREHLVKSC